MVSIENFNRQTTSDIYVVIKKNIKKYRKSLELTQQDLADITKYSHEYIRRVESPKATNGFSLEFLFVISQALRIPMDLLFNDDILEEK